MIELNGKVIRTELAGQVRELVAAPQQQPAIGVRLAAFLPHERDPSAGQVKVLFGEDLLEQVMRTVRHGQRIVEADQFNKDLLGFRHYSPHGNG